MDFALHRSPQKIDHSLYPPRPVADDAISLADTTVTTNNEDLGPSEIDDEDKKLLEEQLRPADMSPGLWELWGRIQRRGLEPLFPADWQRDFLTVPDALFHPHNDNLFRLPRSLLPAISSSTESGRFRGIKAFERLTLLGAQVRDRQELSDVRAVEFHNGGKFLPVEPLIYAECDQFLKWASKDGGLGRDGLTELSTYLILLSLPKLKSMAAVSDARRRSSFNSRTSVHLPPDQYTSEQDYLFIASQMEQRLRALSAIHHEASTKRHAQLPIHKYPTPPPPWSSNDFPTIYGLAIANSKVALIAHSASQPQTNPIRTLLVCDFGDPSQDLWNAIAIALVILAARDECRDRAEVGGYEQEIRKLMGKLEDIKMGEDEDE